FEPRVCPAVEPPAGCEESSARPLCTVRKIAESSAPFGIDGRLRAVLTETGLRWRVELSVSCKGGRHIETNCYSQTLPTENRHAPGVAVVGPAGGGPPPHGGAGGALRAGVWAGRRRKHNWGEKNPAARRRLRAIAKAENRHQPAKSLPRPAANLHPGTAIVKR